MQNASPGVLARPAITLAGLLFAVFMFAHPENNATGAQSPAWLPVHIAWFLSYLLLLFGFPAVHGLAAASRSWLGLTGYWLAWVGVALSLPLAAWDAFIVPYLAVHVDGAVEQIEELSSDPPAVAFRVLVYIGVLSFCLGFLLLGIALLRSTPALRLGGLLLAAGAPLFWIGALTVSQGPLGNSVTITGALLFGIGLLLLARRLTARTAAVAPAR